LSQESITVRRLAGSELELLRVESLRHSFGKHTHDGVSIGVIDAGVGEFWCRGETHRVPPDSVVLIDPGEVHTGGVARGHDALTYRMVYVPLAVAQEMTAGEWWPFSTPAAIVPSLAATARRLHAAVTGGGSLLECESALSDLLTGAASRFGDRGRRSAHVPDREHRQMEWARDYLHAHAAEDVSLRELAELVDLSPSYVSRVFRAHYGLPPHAYQLQVRLQMAKTRLAVGESISGTAVTLGFVDQAHFTTAFKRSFGITPGRYRRCVSGARPTIEAFPSASRA
jgi:AraC-like DNA-binding protein